MKNIKRIYVLLTALTCVYESVLSQNYAQIVRELENMLEEYDVYISERVANGYITSSTSSATVSFEPPMLTVQITRTNNSTYNPESFTIRAKFDILKSRFVKGDKFKYNGYWSDGSEKTGLTVISEAGITLNYLKTGKKVLSEQMYFSGNDIVTRRINNALLQLQSISKENNIKESKPHMFDDAELVVDSVTFNEPEGDNKLGPGETGCISVFISNKNTNDATSIDCVISADGSSETFLYDNYHSLNFIQGNHTQIISIPIKASNDIDNSSYRFSVLVKYKGKTINNSNIDIITYNKQMLIKQPPVIKSGTSGKTLENKSRTIKMKKMSGNTYQLSCKVNELPMNFILDTGASSVTISKRYADFMMKNGYLTKMDIKSKQTYQTADGSLSVGTIVTIKKIEIGGIPLYNVEAAIINSNDAPLLLGQSALSKLGKIQIDFKNSVLTIMK